MKTTEISPSAQVELSNLHNEVVKVITGISEHGTQLSLELAAQHRDLIPNIPHIEHWFSPIAVGELAFIRYLILQMENEAARNLASLVFSRIVLKVSNQDAETRYAATEKTVLPGFTLQSFLTDLHAIRQKVTLTAPFLHLSDAKFYTVDTRVVSTTLLPENSIDLIVTSPPYPNATDYHLYHRFRLYWLGYQPHSFAQAEIGSHLKHQRENSGFENYLADLRWCLQRLYRTLRPGRYAVFVVGDGIYKGVLFHTAESLSHIARECGFEECGNMERSIHESKRSFIHAARRAQTETIVVLRKPTLSERITVTIAPPNYRLWPHEEILRKREIEVLLKERIMASNWNGIVTFAISAYQVPYLQQLTFSHNITSSDSLALRTWQALLENGHNTPGRRKEPKYATHGLHPYKGKFYPQLAKALINISGVETEATVFDPFCGSGTMILEAFLNGYTGIGCDMHPLAAKITKAKIDILTISEGECQKGISKFIEKLELVPTTFPQSTACFAEETVDEIFRWFPKPVVYKLNWLLSRVRVIKIPAIREFLEVILSSIIRDVSQQEPRDLRIRRRTIPLEDAPVIELFTQRALEQFKLLQAFWKVFEHQPVPSVYPRVALGDCRKPETLRDLGLEKETVDLIVTSPPYATALPYIDTDRLSLLVLLGMTSKERGLLEEQLTGSREISKHEKETLETLLNDAEETIGLPSDLLKLVGDIYNRNQRTVSGFRKQNLPALLFRYFRDMKLAFDNMAYVLKPGASSFVVVGDSKTTAGEDIIPIPTGALLAEVASHCGLRCIEQIPISVTTENMAHIRNAIVENVILHFVRET